MITRIGETPANTGLDVGRHRRAIADQMMEVNDLQGGDEEEEAGRPRNKEVVELRIYRPYLCVTRSKADVLLERPKNESREGRAQAFRSALGMGDGCKPSAKAILSNKKARATWAGNVVRETARDERERAEALHEILSAKNFLSALLADGAAAPEPEQLGDRRRHLRVLVAQALVLLPRTSVACAVTAASSSSGVISGGCRSPPEGLAVALGHPLFEAVRDADRFGFRRPRRHRLERPARALEADDLLLAALDLLRVATP